MELCANRALHSNIPISRPLSPSPQIRLFTPSLLRLRTHSGNVCCRSKLSEDAPIERTKFDWEKTNTIVSLQDEKNTPVEDETSPQEDSSLDEQMQQPLAQLFDNLNLKLDMEDSYVLFLFGGGALVSVWLLSAVVGAIDAIPVFPKLMEVVGLSYSVWFTTRYLLFKENRDELVAKIEGLKQQVLGSDKE